MEDLYSVGIREFRANLHKYTRQLNEPIAITSHGETVGYFVPARPAPDQQDVAALLEAVRRLSALLEAKGVDEAEILADFQTTRQQEPDRYPSERSTTHG